LVGLAAGFNLSAAISKATPLRKILEVKIAPESGIEVVFFLLVTGKTEGLQIADIVGAATGKGDDVIDGKVSF